MENDNQTDDDFATMKESELGESQQDMFEEGQVLEEKEILNDAVCQLSLVHQDHVYCVSAVPKAPFNTFLSGDGGDKCYMWTVKPRKDEEEKGEHFPGSKGPKYECQKIGELEGHTETVEFIKFNHDGKLCVTGGMNNALRVWALEQNPDPTTQDHKMKLKTTLVNGPGDGEDILFVEWHPKGNAVLCGGKDYCIYLLNGATGDFLACFTGHEDTVLACKFTFNGKLIVSASNDASLRVWSPIKQECISVIKPRNKSTKFHTTGINCFALHPEQPYCISGDLAGAVYYSNYLTGEIGHQMGQHDNSVEEFAFCLAADSPYVVSCGMDPTINIYNYKESRLRTQVKGAESGGFTKLLFS